MRWQRKMFSMQVRNSTAKDLLDGFVEENGLFALYMFDRFVDVTHVPSGARVARCRSLADADEFVRCCYLIDIPWGLRQPVFTVVAEARFLRLKRDLAIEV